MRPTDKTRNQDLPCGQGGDHSTLYVSLELSRSTWLVTSLSPNSDKMSKHTIASGDAPQLLALLARLRGRAELVGGSLSIAVIQEAGLDGFWVHRSLEANDIESHVVDPASIAVSRRRRRAKTDGIDGETLRSDLLSCTDSTACACRASRGPFTESEE
jgi:transposase